MPKVISHRCVGKISTKRCIVCEKVFKSFRSDTKTCSEACRSKLYRQRHGTSVKAQAKIIQTQAKIIETISPVPDRITDVAKSPLLKPIQELSVIVGKDLAECKRPDGKHFYTDNDLRILYSLLLFTIRTEPKLITVLATGPYDDSNTIGKLIQDFERRFECKFWDVKKANPHIHFNQENMDLTDKLPNLNYSR